MNDLGRCEAPAVHDDDDNDPRQMMTLLQRSQSITLLAVLMNALLRTGSRNRN